MTETTSGPSLENFGNQFVWGVSTAAYQIEGAHDADGKGASVWDRFVTKKGAIYESQHGRNACDFYHRYEQDILLLKEMNISNFRFSIAWSRILPDGYGSVNWAGIDFYNKVIDCCLKNGVTPWLTLYHWDLPQALEDQGGWTQREILGWFRNYASVCAKHFGDRVKNWMVLNEPMVFTGAGYFLGVHAPGRKGLKHFLPAVHHAVLAQAQGGRVLRSEISNANIGTTFSCSMITPSSTRSKDIQAAKRADALLNRLFVEPSLGLGYPVETLPVLKKLEKYQLSSDQAESKFDFDFIGIQNYTREVVRHSRWVPYVRARIVKASQRNVPTTLMDWEIYPPSIYRMIAKFNNYEGIKKILITENGAAFRDIVQKDRIPDKARCSYLKAYIKEVEKAKRDGLKVDGYFVWTLMDNFEWAEGYYPRFGLVHVDFETQQRTVKDSGKWFGEFLGS